MHVADSELDRIWHLAQSSLCSEYRYDISALCDTAAAVEALPGHHADALRRLVRDQLARESIIWRARSANDARGLWRAPTGKLIFWSTSRQGTFWCDAREMDLSAIDALVAAASGTHASGREGIPEGGPPRRSRLQSGRTALRSGPGAPRASSRRTGLLSVGQSARHRRLIARGSEAP